jgi:hypothetical protein
MLAGAPGEPGTPGGRLAGRSDPDERAGSDPRGHGGLRGRPSGPMLLLAALDRRVLLLLPPRIPPHPPHTAATSGAAADILVTVWAAASWACCVGGQRVSAVRGSAGGVPCEHSCAQNASKPRRMEQTACAARTDIPPGDEQRGGEAGKIVVAVADEDDVSPMTALLAGDRGDEDGAGVGGGHCGASCGVCLVPPPARHPASCSLVDPLAAVEEAPGRLADAARRQTARRPAKRL